MCGKKLSSHYKGNKIALIISNLLAKSLKNQLQTLSEKITHFYYSMELFLKNLSYYEICYTG